jgi:hypothetical protein
MRPGQWSESPPCAGSTAEIACGEGKVDLEEHASLARNAQGRSGDGSCRSWTGFLRSSGAPGSSSDA